MTRIHTTKILKTLVIVVSASIAFSSCAESDSPIAAAPAVVCDANLVLRSVTDTRALGSAARFANERWESIADFAPQTTFVPPALTPRAFSVPFADGYDRSLLPIWPGSEGELQSAFELARDDTRYVDRNRKTLKRRATWLYPYDGCASRSAHVTRRMLERGLPAPAKLYAFGNLRVKTPFQRGGTAYWWYHTAPAYRIGSETYVMDASVETKRPLTLHEWLSRMSSRPSTVKLAICDANAFNAESICRGGAIDQDRDFENNMRSYLPKEWQNLESLGYDPSRLLGDEPPWEVEAVPSEARCQPSAGAGAR
ncbi:MAG: protein-glutamine glutaminase family protein [Bdellovibrionota bacterium]